MKKVMLALVGLAVGLLLVSAACGDGGGKEEPTATAQAPEATATEAGTPAGTPETPPSAAELAADFTTIRAVMQDVITKAQAGDVQGTRDAEGQGDDAIEAIIEALRGVGDATPTALADQIEALELDYEGQADSDTTDLTVMASDAQQVLTLLDQAETALNVSP